MSKIRILAIPPDTHGVGKYRVLDPFKFISQNYPDDVHVDIINRVDNIDAFFNEYDIVVFHSFIHQTTHDDNVNRIKYLKDKGIKVVMDIDDMWHVHSQHPAYRTLIQNKIPEKKVEMLKSADYVTTTTATFASTIKKRLSIDKIHVFPNAVDDTEPQFQPQPISSDRIRFGWLGGSSHLIDLQLMANNISSILHSYIDKVQFVSCGFDTRGKMSYINEETGEINERPINPKETVWYEYEKMFTDNYKFLDKDYTDYLNSFMQLPYDDAKKSYIRRWTQDISKYAFNYNYFDISLAPLVENEFNINKSQLKVIEAGFHKKALIASETLPYTLDLVSAIDNGKINDKGNAFLVSQNKNHKQWAQHMKKLIDNPNLIEDMGNRLYETVKDKYSLKNVCKNRVEFFKSII